MSAVRPSAREIVECGRAIYESRIRPIVERVYFGKRLATDIETGEFEIDEDPLTASQRADAKRPNGLRRATGIGYRTRVRLRPAVAADGRSALANAGVTS